MRYVYRIPPLSDAPLDDVAGPVGRAIHWYLTAGAGPDQALESQAISKRWPSGSAKYPE